MAKASPMVRTFNAGEFSDLLIGRVDLDRYPASVQKMVNTIAAPQGPAIGRSGTALVANAYDETEKSTLAPFVFSSEVAKVLEVSRTKIRFLDEDGLQVYDAVSGTITSAPSDDIVVSAVGLSAIVGDGVVLAGFPASYNLNGEVARVVSVAGDVYTLDKPHPDEPVLPCEVSRVYSVDCDYTEDQIKTLRVEQSVDVLYLLTGSRRPQKLSRFGDYDWRLEDIEFIDGPYLPTNETSNKITPSATGNAIPSMTSDTLPSGVCGGSGNRPAIAGTPGTPVNFLGRNLTYGLDASEFYYAFDEDDETYFASNTEQSGTLVYTPDSGFVADGYTVYVAKDNQDTDYTSTDYAPSSFTFEGYDGTNWNVLDSQDDYVLYENAKSVFIEIDNTVSYQAYRLAVSKLTRNGLIEMRVRRLVIRERDSAPVTLTADSTTNLNDGTGFVSTDVGRLIRLKGSDGAWRACTITTVVSSTQVTARVEGEPFLDLKPIKDWRLGHWSDTTGWPVAGRFFEDSLWLVGSGYAPDMFAKSVTGAYETFAQTDTFGVVLDTSAIVGRLNSRQLSAIRWLSSDSRGLILGTGSEEYTIAAPSNEALTARNIRARPATRRGSTKTEPVSVDNQTLFVQRGGRKIREMAYLFEVDGYRSPSMSQLASHLGSSPFEQIEFAAEPHSVLWTRRVDNSIVAMTYNREESVVGWHQHNLSGGEVEAMTVVPQRDELQDALWLVVKRTIGGTTKRFIERLMPFWDFDKTLSDAHFVDCGLRYVGPATSDVYGLQHLEGEEVYGLADGNPVGPLIVQNGGVTLPFEGENVVIGLGFDAEVVLQRLENGAADGTSQGKTKRINNLTLSVWSSYGGEVGVYSGETGEVEYEPLEYPGRFDEFEDVELYTGELPIVIPNPGYNVRGVIGFRRPKNSPLPFNVLAVMPQLNTQDR